MAVENISLATKFEGYSSEGKQGIRFHQYYDETTSDRDVRLVFSTLYGPDVQASFDVWFTYSGYRKGGLAETAKVDVTKTISANDAHCVAGGDGRWWWSIPLTAVYDGFTGSSGKWTFANRTWDNLELDAWVRCTWKSPIEGHSHSAWYESVLWISYVPTYTLTSAYYGSDGDLLIHYTATDWTRPDDRWAIDEGTVNGTNAFLANTWGTVSGYGLVKVPKERISADLTAGRLYLKLRFNASFRPVNLEFATISTKMANTSDPSKETSSDPGIKINDWKNESPTNRAYQADTPIITVVGVTSTGSARIRVTDSGDHGKPITHVIVKSTRYGYSFDGTDIPIGSVGSLDFLPIGEKVPIYGYGLDGQGGVSNTVYATVDMTSGETADSDGIVLQSITDPTFITWIRYHKDGETLLPTVKTTPNVQVVKLSGRRRPSAYFGPGASVDVSFSGWFIPEYDDAPITEYGELVETGIFMARFPDGQRYVIEGDVTVEPDSSGCYKVSVSGQEVDA